MTPRSHGNADVLSGRSQSEYQKSYGVSRSRSVSPRRCLPLAGISREPGLQRLKRPSPLGANQSSSSLLGSPEDPGAPRRAPSASRNGECLQVLRAAQHTRIHLQQTLDHRRFLGLHRNLSL
ncbi:hypothetical protein GOODEAATRI_000792 [Goodea atripinnis]|uniref:Uncharacterized protein n=1 Tax=Goodea atripinnis TaxID=208336 RepID=A0ABV0NQT2_9TELE